MKRKTQRKKGKKDTGKLQKYMVLVDKFVKSKISSDETEDDSKLRFVKKINRKELRKAKRKVKKTKMKNYYEGNKHLNETLLLNPDLEKAEHERSCSDKQRNKTSVKAKVSRNEKTIQKTSDHDTAQIKKQKTKKQIDPKEASVKQERKKNKLQETRNKALLEANVEEDKEIKKLERYLGLNRRKNKKTLPLSFVADGLDYVLGALDPSAAGMYDDDDDMEVAKANFEKLDDSESEMSSDNEKQVNQESDGTMDVIAEEDEEDEEIEEEEDDEGDESEEEEMDEDDISEVDAEEEVNEETVNQDVKTVPATGKYVPPHLREPGDARRKAELERLRRTVKGLVNRVTEHNMASVANQMEELYMSSSRKEMNDALTEVLLASCVTPALATDRLLMEHMLLVSVLHHTVGLEVGAHFLETVVRQFDWTYHSHGEGKECDNLVAMVAHLYNFQVVHSVLIFDVLKRLVDAFGQKDIELVLFVLRNVGFSLRKDDALALKELIAEAQRKATEVGAKFQDQTRVKFMLQTMLALKNNDMRKIPGYDPEPMEKLKKLQRTLVQRRAVGSDVKLRVSLENLLAAEQVGRWWIVGSSWSGAPMVGDHGNKTPGLPLAEGKFSSRVLELARKQRMNTDIRRTIFCMVMTSEDYLDAFEKLLRLGLKDQQEREIVHVLMDCCLQEKNFNAFYAVLGDKFCAHDRRFQMTFQFSLWDKFKELSSLSSSSFSNLVQLVSLFLQRKSLPLSILKVIEFGELDKPKVRFLRQVLTKLLTEADSEELAHIFGRISGIPKLGMLREGLKLFISHFLLKNARSLGTAEEAALLTERMEVAVRALEANEAKLKL